MLSSDKNVETIAQLIEAVKHYLGLQTEYVKLDIIDKMVRLLKAAALIVLLLIVLLFVLLFASIGLAIWLSKSIGLAGAFLVVAAVYLVVLLIGYAFRKPWLERPLVRRLARMLLHEP